MVVPAPQIIEPNNAHLVSSVFLPCYFHIVSHKYHIVFPLIFYLVIVVGRMVKAPLHQREVATGFICQESQGKVSKSG